MSDKLPVYEPGAGEDIQVSATNALQLAKEKNVAVTLKTSAGGEICVFPDNSVDSVVRAFYRKVNAVVGTISEQPIDNKEMGDDKSKQLYAEHVKTISDINCKKISELLEWFEKLYELQQKIYIKDNSMAQEIIKTLENNGYATGYKSPLTPQEMLASPEETRKWFIGTLMKTLQEDGVLRHFNMSFIDEHRQLLESK